jgi:hypothetical protein
MEQKYISEYLASVNGDSSLTIDSKNLITKHITGLFAFARDREAAERNTPRTTTNTPKNIQAYQPESSQAQQASPIRSPLNRTP